jgi:phage protein D
MQHDNVRIEIEGTAVEDDFYLDMVLEVELDDQLAGMFRITQPMQYVAGSWIYLEDERIAIWRKVVITAGLADDSQQLLTGYITHLRPDFAAGLDQCRLEIWGMDASVLMDRVDRLKDWPNKKDSDIAAEVFQTYGLTPQVTDTDVIHDEEVSTIIQRETDIQLLKRLALRNGFECFVDGDTGYFWPPAVDDTPQPVLAVQFGDETNVNWLKLEVNALTPANVAMSQLDHVSCDILEASAEISQQPALGSNRPASLLGPGMEPGLVCIGQAVTTGNPEMAALCQGLYDQAEWFVTGEGEVAANHYGSILKPRSTVTIKGIGEAHSGVYYVTHVTHRFSVDGYTQTFRVKRNALLPTGAENFTIGADGLPADPTGGV